MQLSRGMTFTWLGIHFNTNKASNFTAVERNHNISESHNREFGRSNSLQTNTEVHYSKCVFILLQQCYIPHDKPPRIALLNNVGEESRARDIMLPVRVHAVHNIPAHTQWGDADFTSSRDYNTC